MPISLHQALVPTWIQMIAGLEAILDKAEAHCGECGMESGTLADSKLAPDMFDFAYQVKSARSHSIGAIEGVRAGTYSPDMSEAPRSIAAMKEMLGDTRAALDALDPDELEGFIGQPMEFSFRGNVLPFVAEEFLLSFSQPNFFFHVTTAYALLRNQGVEIGKRDYMGPVRISTP